MGDTLLPLSTDQFNLSRMSYTRDAFLVTEEPAARGKQLVGMNFLLEQPESELPEVVRRAKLDPKLSVVTTARRAKVPKRKPGKKDRHSKIPTAKGLRDRRMRLSLDIARKFFKLQDLLGYDKASKTVKWLMDNAQPAIKQLARSTYLPAVRVPSEAENEMVTDWEGSSKQEYDTTRDHTEAGKEKERGLPPSQKATMGSLRRAVSLPVARESREKARARARERTKAKKLKRRLEETVDQEDQRTKSKTICPSSELVAQLPEISCHSQDNEHSSSTDDMTHDSFRSIFDYNGSYGLFLNDQYHDAGDGRIRWTDELITDWNSDDLTMSSASFSLLDMHSSLQLTGLQSFPKAWEFNTY